MDQTKLAPVVDDMSAYILGGRSTDASVGIAHAIEAERLGFRRVWISERYNMKECGVLFGAICASTPRLIVGTGAMTIAARPPIVTASIGATINSAFGPRAILGLGVGNPEYNKPHGLPVLSNDALLDYARIIKRLYRGETVDYDGPAGSYRGLVFPDVLPEGREPEIWHVQIGGPKACKVSADPAFDGVLVGFFNTPAAIGESIRMIREECERIGRDPATLRIAASVCTAPDFDPARADHPGIANPSYGGGLVTKDQLKILFTLFATEPKVSAGAIRRNGWDEAIVKKLLAHPLFEGMHDVAPDYFFRDRNQLLDAANIIPDEWVEEACAVGSTSACVAKLQEFRDAGADEVAIYCSTPGQNADVIGAWRERAQAGRPQESAMAGL